MRRITATAAILIGLALTASACAKGPSQPSAIASADTVLGNPSAAPAESASPAPASSPTGSGCGMSGHVSGGEGDSLIFMKAWLTCDTAKLHTVLSDPAFGQVTAIGVPKLDMNWSFVSCDGAMGSNYCTFRNKLGSDLLLHLRNDLTVKAIVEVTLTPTVYHSDPEKYAREFLEAFVNHNKPRMVALSSQAIVDSIVVDAPPAGFDLVLMPEPHWVYNAQFTATGENWVVTIHGTLGKSHAITAFGNAG
jgi:hypothetical protein